MGLIGLSCETDNVLCIAQGLASITSLKHLECVGLIGIEDSISGETVETIPNLIPDNKNIQSIKLHSTKMPAELMERIAEEATNHASLCTLSLEKMREAGTRAFHILSKQARS
jgi:hypothetical protein